MRKKLALAMTLMVVFSAGCSKEAVLSAQNKANQAQSEVSAENVADEQANNAKDANSAESSTENTDAENSAGDASSVAASFNPDDIVEPEIAEEEITQPVDVLQKDAEADAAAATEAEAQTETAPAEDNTIDIVFLGDSQFDNARDTGSEIPAYTRALMGDDVRVYNLGIGGTCASIERGASDLPQDIKDSCFVGICYALAGQLPDDSFMDNTSAAEDYRKVNPANVDFYVIEYGANDYINGKDLSTEGEPFDIHSFRGALNKGCDILSSISPKAKFIICSPSYCIWYGADGYVIGDSYTVSKGIGTLAEYADISRNLCEDDGYFYLDTMYATYYDLKITTFEDYLADGLHYKEIGRQVYATVLAHFLNKSLGRDDSELPYIEINSFTYNN
jgi:hypothetical protein